MAERYARRVFSPRVVSYSQTIPIEMSFDGACRGNPSNQAGAGCEIIINKGQRLHPVEEPIEERIQIRHYLQGGGHTSNKAEYEGLIVGFTIVLEHVKSTILRKRDRRSSTPSTLTVDLTVKGDSELVIRQMDGSYRVQDMKYAKERASKIVDEIASFVDELNIQFQHIPREQNTVADGK